MRRLIRSETDAALTQYRLAVDASLLIRMVDVSLDAYVRRSLVRMAADGRGAGSRIFRPAGGQVRRFGRFRWMDFAGFAGLTWLPTVRTAVERQEIALMLPAQHFKLNVCDCVSLLLTATKPPPEKETTTRVKWKWMVFSKSRLTCTPRFIRTSRLRMAE